MKTVVHQYWDFLINLFPGLSAGTDSSKPARNPERAFSHSREVGGNLVSQTKTSRMKQAAMFFLVCIDLKPRIYNELAARLEISGLQSCDGAGVPMGS